jgi:hypothetical protein
MATPPKPPYVEKLEDRGEISIWLVDGAYIRGHIDEEFTTCGQHYHCHYIPENEIWLEKALKKNEWRFCVDHMLVERRLMAQGTTYDDALEAADKIERKERRRTGDIRKLTQSGKELPDPEAVHTRLWKKLNNGVSVWVVNGRLVRSVFDIDFVEGGHNYVYEFVPENEVWIDDETEEKERGFILLHELHERNLMAKGWTYDKAHVDSSILEYHYRHHPDELHEALGKEGWA